MKQNRSAVLNPYNKPPSRHLVRCACIMALLISGLGPMVMADDSKEVFDLPSIEVRPDLSMPLPAKTVAPRLSNGLIGTEIRMIFKIDRKGKPYEIRYRPTVDDDELSLGAAMRQNLACWRFTPAKDKRGREVAVKVMMPVRVVAKGNGNADKYASLMPFDPVLLAVLD